jgi:hypothetical protein
MHLPMRLDVHLMLSIHEAPDTNGLILRLLGDFYVDGLGSVLRFQNAGGGLHPYTTSGTAESVLVEAREKLSVEREAVAPRPRGASGVWIQLRDSNVQPLTTEILLGHWKAGPFKMRSEFHTPCQAVVWVKAQDCELRGGPGLALDGEVSFLDHITARVLLLPKGKSPTNAAPTEGVEIPLLAPGESIPFGERTVRGGVGGTPRVTLQFVNGSGARLGSEFLVGRCVQLR